MADSTSPTPTDLARLSEIFDQVVRYTEQLEVLTDPREREALWIKIRAAQEDFNRIVPPSTGHSA